MSKEVNWQEECLKKGFEYVREPDDHYVIAAPAEMVALLRDLLGVDVRTKDGDDYGIAVSDLQEQVGGLVNTLHAQQAERDALLAERDDLLRQVETLTDWYSNSLNVINEVTAALPGVQYMDPPDGGDVSVPEQVRRMAKDAERRVPLYEAIERACGELPDGWTIMLCAEHHAGTVELYGQDGSREEFPTNNERLDYTVIDALNHALQGAQPCT